MILGIYSFKDKITEDIFDGNDSKHARKIPKNNWQIAFRKLDMINSCHDIVDLKVPPGNRLKQLKGKLKGYYSIRINDQYRIIFEWFNGNGFSYEIFIVRNWIQGYSISYLI